MRAACNVTGVADVQCEVWSEDSWLNFAIEVLARAKFCLAPGAPPARIVELAADQLMRPAKLSRTEDLRDREVLL